LCSPPSQDARRWSPRRPQPTDNIFRPAPPGRPARAYLGVDHLLGGAKFEVMGIAAKR